MNRVLSLSAAAIAAVSLSGCGGGGGSTAVATGNSASGEEIIVPSGVTTAEALAQFAAVNQGFDNVARDTTDQTELPTAGSAEYTGTLGFDVSGAVPGGGANDFDASFVGDLALTVNFAPDQNGDQTVSGSVTDILYADTAGVFDETSGSLTVDGSIQPLERDGLPDLEGVLGATATGDIVISRPDGDQDVNLALSLAGQFGDLDANNGGNIPDAVRGFVVGEGTGDLTLDAPNGRFSAETGNAGILP